MLNTIRTTGLATARPADVHTQTALGCPVRSRVIVVASALLACACGSKSHDICRSAWETPGSGVNSNSIVGRVTTTTLDRGEMTVYAESGLGNRTVSLIGEDSVVSRTDLDGCFVLLVSHPGLHTVAVREESGEALAARGVWVSRRRDGRYTQYPKSVDITLPALSVLRVTVPDESRVGSISLERLERGKWLGHGGLGIRGRYLPEIIYADIGPGDYRLIAFARGEGVVPSYDAFQFYPSSEEYPDGMIITVGLGEVVLPEWIIDERLFRPKRRFSEDE